MTRTLPLVVLIAVALAGAPALGALPAPPATISGFPPYVLGADVRTVLRADPELSPGDYPLWANDLLTRRYGRSIVAPIGGVNYIALVGLQFWEGRLAVAILKWPARSFPSVDAWRHAAGDLRQLIMTRYAHAAMTTHVVGSGPTWTIDLADAEGNVLSAWSTERPSDITMVYLWAPYVKALESAPAPGGGY